MTLDTSGYIYYLLSTDAMIIEVAGVDAAKVMNNLTTNNIAVLAEGDACETFVTDVRGWVVAHGFVFKQLNRIILLGQHPNVERVCQHIDRYIVREDAQVRNLSDQHVVALVDSSVGMAPLLPETLGLTTCQSISAPILSSTSRLWFGTADLREKLEHGDAARPLDEDQFQLLRIRNFWPLMGQEIGEKCIPQEIDHDAQAISFTKGCYLGQETIARLDARGQLQKKMCLLRIEAEQVSPHAVLENEAKELGHVTSATYDPVERVTYALAYLKRGNFEPGHRLTCAGAMATVIAPQSR